MPEDIQVLDVVGLACPIPIIKLKRELSQLKAQPAVKLVQIIFSDKGGLKDIPAFCKQAGLECRESIDNVALRAKQKTLDLDVYCFEILL